LLITERQTLVLDALRKRLDRDDEGFTLIELMVVVLIIAILLAIAIPTFLGARERANDRAAQSSLRNALTAAKTLYTDNQDYVDATVVAMTAVEPSLVYPVTGLSKGFKEVAFTVGLAANAVKTEWAATALSKTGKCFYIHEVSVHVTGSTAPTSGTFFGNRADQTTCASADALAAVGDSFNVAM
jgi:type IV pilus assembly protein PilA